MKNLKFFILISIFSFSCESEITSFQEESLSTIEEENEAYYLDLETIKKRYPTAFELNDALVETETRSSCFFTRVSAGSINALGPAIEATCPNGTIYLESGVHTQSENIIITKPIKLIGAEGATLELDADDLDHLPTEPIPANPAIHILNTSDVLIQNVDLVSVNEFGNAILVENAPRCGFLHNSFTGFQTSLITEKANETVIINNEITTSSIWQSGETTNAHAIIIMNGKSCYISRNNISNSFFGAWLCDQWGTFESNISIGNVMGMILCNVPPAIQLPSGEVTGSEFPAQGWKVRSNEANSNVSTGYLFIDGANNNIFQNNTASENGVYDVELAGDSERFGFFTPTSSNNFVDASNAPSMRVKNCGTDNLVTGGTSIDTIMDECN